MFFSQTSEILTESQISRLHRKAKGILDIKAGEGDGQRYCHSQSPPQFCSWGVSSSGVKAGFLATESSSISMFATRQGRVQFFNASRLLEGYRKRLALPLSVLFPLNDDGDDGCVKLAILSLGGGSSKHVSQGVSRDQEQVSKRQFTTRSQEASDAHAPTSALQVISMHIGTVCPGILGLLLASLESFGFRRWNQRTKIRAPTTPEAMPAVVKKWHNLLLRHLLR